LPDRTTQLPALGLGTWRMGEVARRKGDEVAAVRLAFELGYRLIDTAEMYGEGGAEQVVGQALAEALRAGTLRRDELFIVSKVYPHNASRTAATSSPLRRATSPMRQVPSPSAGSCVVRSGKVTVRIGAVCRKLRRQDLSLA